jgi:type IV secretory pathway VirD2 relaxase
MRYRSRRVFVNTRVIKLKGSTSRAAEIHLRYLERDGVTREGQRGQAYSASEDEADGKAFLERGRGDRHQFRLIVAPEDAAELASLRDFTRDLMAQMAQDLKTELDWIAVDHHNTGHPHTHVLIRGLTDEGRILNIAGDYIAYGIRARASKLVTLELGPQSEWQVQQKLAREIDQDRFTQLDRVLIQEANDDGMFDLQESVKQSRLARADRYVLIDRIKRLERMGLASEQEPGRWSLSRQMEATLKAMGERKDIIDTMYRALERWGIERDLGSYLIHQDTVAAPIVGRLVGKGLGHGELVDNELADKVHVVIDATDGRVHYVELGDPSLLDDLRRASIIEISPEEIGKTDRAIAIVAQHAHGVYSSRAHLAVAREQGSVPHDDYAGYVDAHVRRLKALRSAGIVERLDADHWYIPKDFEQRAADADAKRGRPVAVRVLSARDLDTQVTSQGATWLDRLLVGRDQITAVQVGFGYELEQALERRRRHLIDHGHAVRASDGQMHYRRDLIATLTGQELMQVGERLAQERQIPFRLPPEHGHLSGTFRRTLQLISGKFAIIERSHDFTLVPWRPVMEQHRGRQVAGHVIAGSISWLSRRQRGLGVTM